MRKVSSLRLGVQVEIVSHVSRLEVEQHKRPLYRFSSEVIALAEIPH